MKFWKYDFHSGHELEPASYEFVAKWFAAKRPFIEETCAGFVRKVVLKEKHDSK